MEQKVMTRTPRPVDRVEVRPGGVVGRDGEVLFRNRASEDALDVPERYKDDGWDYQWVRTSTYGEPDNANVSMSMDAAWRPVPQKRMPGYLGASSESDEPIEYRGLMLMERPIEFTIQAQMEMRTAANRQLVAQHERFEVPLPDNARGFETSPGHVRYGRSEQVETHTYPSRGYRAGDIPD